jgi:excisionase family DNA binding protein
LNVELHGLEETIRAIVREELERLGNGSPWLDREAAARYLSLPVSRLEKDRAIPFHREGRRVLYHREELDAYMFSNLDMPSDPV